jgi:hypothetical protein
MANLVISKITMQPEGEFGTTRLVTKAQQSLGASQMSFFFPISFWFSNSLNLCVLYIYICI